MEVAFPLKLSQNRRYLEDQKGTPFLISGDAPWDIFQNVELEHARDYLRDRKQRGFNTLLVTMVADRHDSMRDRWGRWPFDAVSDFTRPNEEYWAHVDTVMEEMTRHGFLIFACPTWLGHGVKPIWRNSITAEAMKSFGPFLAKRYGDYQNLIWLLGGDRDPEPESEPGIRVLADILYRETPHQLITYHPGPNNPSAKFFHQDPWHSINVAYTYQIAYAQVREEWQRTGPRLPVFLCETGYEGEDNGGVDWTPLNVRKQHWWSLTSGACGHVHGAAKLWWFAPGWREWMDKPGTRHLGHLRAFFMSRSWWTLEPEQQGELVVDGSGEIGSWEYATATRSSDGKWAVVYLPSARAITLNMARLAGPATAAWFDPTSGALQAIEAEPFPNQGRRTFTSPERNAAGDGDWVLLLETHE